MLLRSGRMTTNSQRNHSNNNNNNNVADTSTNNNGSNEKNQTNPSSEVNNEMVMGASQPNNEPINVSGEDTMRSQVQTTNVETSLPQNNLVSTTNTPLFSTTRPWGMPPLSLNSCWIWVQDKLQEDNCII